jgi:fibronectin-binding autotransporter adhesin
MKTFIRYLVLIVATLVLGLGTAKSQTAYFTNFLGGDWNIAANWDLDFTGVNVVPAGGTNANLASVGAVTVDYNAPMAATSFGGLTVDGGVTLNINAAGFNQDLGGVGTAPLALGSGFVNVGSAGIWTATNGGTVTIGLGGSLSVAGKAYFAPVALTAPLTINTGGRADVTTGGTLTVADGGVNTVTGTLTVTDGSLVISNCQTFTISPGAAVAVTNGTILQTSSPSGTIAFGANNNNTTTLFQMEGGTVTFDTLLDIRGRKSGLIMNGGTLTCLGGSQLREQGTDDLNRLVVNGGLATLGAFEVHRTASGGGLIVSNGVVHTTSLRVGRWNSASYATIWGGAVTNTGAFTICDRSNGAIGTTDRRARLLIRGGTVASTDAAGVIVANQSNVGVGGTAAAIGGILDINAGTLIAEGITLVKDNTLTNAHAVLNLSGTGLISLGSVGLTGNVGPVNTSYAINMSGGTLAAHNNFAINANVTLTGTAATFQAANLSGSPFGITVNGVVSGAGVLNKTGTGTLTLNANNTYGSFTVINAGTLALGATGSIVNSPKITIAAGATFDVSATGFSLASGRTLAGAGTVAGTFTAQGGATLSPGTSAGTLNFANGLTLQGGVAVALELSDDPTGTIKTNDQISVIGDLDASAGVTTLLVTALDASIPSGVYKVIGYTGNLIGSTANFTVSGVSATVSNNAALKSIYLITTAMRGPGNVTWVGNPTVNDWDALNTTNWSNGGVLDFFVSGDDVLFDALGAANPVVNITEIVQPGSVTVGASANYTFTGSGRIGGVAGLTKTNSGTLTVLTTNDFTGATTIGGGVLAASVLANGGVASSIGAASGSPANLVLDGGTVRYTGANQATDRGATLNLGGGTIDVATGGTVLTVNGTVTGDGTLTKAGAGVLVLNPANSYTNGTIINAGVLQINNNNSLGTVNGVTNNGGTLRLNGALTLDRPLTFNGNCTVELTGVGAANVALRAPWAGSGSVLVDFLTANSGQTFSMGGNSPDGGDMDDFSGTVDFGDSTGNARFNNNDSSLNFGSPNATFNLGTNDLILYQRNGGTTTHIGTLKGGPNTRLTGRRGSAPSGTTIYSIGALGVNSEFAGHIEDSLNAAAVVKVGAGKLTLSGNSTYTGATTVQEGTLQVDGSLGNTAVDVGSASVATLSGNGSLAGSVNIGFFGVLAPGSSVGQLAISNTLALQFGSTNFMEIDKANSTNDSVVGLTSVTYGGNLVIVNLGGTLADGDVFKLFDAPLGNYAGVFETIALPTLGANLFWETNSLLVDGTVRVYTPRPTIVSFGVDGGNFYLTGNNGGNTSPQYIVVTSTNVATANWTPVVTNAFAFDGTLAFTNAINPAEPARFYRLKTP